MSNLSGSDAKNLATSYINNTYIEDLETTGDITTPCLITNSDGFTTNAPTNNYLTKQYYNFVIQNQQISGLYHYMVARTAQGQGLLTINVPANTKYEWNVTATSILYTRMVTGQGFPNGYTVFFQSAYSFENSYVEGAIYQANSTPYTGSSTAFTDIYGSFDGGNTYTLQTIPIYYTCSAYSQYSVGYSTTGAVGPKTTFQIILPSISTAATYKLCLGLVFLVNANYTFPSFNVFDFCYNAYGAWEIPLENQITYIDQTANNVTVPSSPTNSTVGQTLINQLAYNKLISRYQWHWNPVTTNSIYIINHNLNLDTEEPIRYRILFSSSPTGLFPLIEVTNQTDVYLMEYIDSNNIQLNTANNFITSGINMHYTSGYWNVYIY